MKKFAVIADTHIRNLKFHDEYRAVFEQIFARLRQEQPYAIVHCGDVVTAKVNLTPECFDLAAYFLKSLADIAPTYVICGNHDAIVSNSARMDAITPVVAALDHKDLHLLRDSGEFKLDDEITFNTLSILDKENWQKPTDLSKINIALFHETVNGVVDDNKWIAKNGYGIDIFDGCDYAFCGHIHRSNQKIDPEGRFRYAGSTVQQNFAEENDKGFLLWSIEDKENFTVEHVVISNPKPFITVKLEGTDGLIAGDLVLPQGARIRLESSVILTNDKIRAISDEIRYNFSAESVVFKHNATAKDELEKRLLQFAATENLRDETVQEKKIAEYLQNYNVDSEMLKRVYELNKKYNAAAVKNEDVVRGTEWRIKEWSWDNLFNYGEGNRINVDALDGVIGIFAKNACGKSSAIGSLLYTLFNDVDKTTRRSANIINQTKEWGVGRVVVSIGDDDYYVERRLERVKDKNDSAKAKTELNFYRISSKTGARTDLNDQTRNDTDREVKRVFGTIEDFLTTSFSSQLGSLSFINEGSSKRKEILAKFLDLQIFEQKHSIGKEDSAALKIALKRLEGIDYDDLVLKALKDCNFNELALQEKEQQKEERVQKLAESEQQLRDVQAKIATLPAYRIDIEEERNRFDGCQERKKALLEKNQQLQQKIGELQIVADKIDKFKEVFDIEAYRQKQEIIVAKALQLDKMLAEIEDYDRKIEREQKKIKLLQEVPCGPEFSHCKFIKDAYEAKREIGRLHEELARRQREKKQLTDESEQLEPEKVKEYLEKYLKVEEKKNSVLREIDSVEINIHKNDAEVLKCAKVAGETQSKIDEYEKNKEVFENFNGLVMQAEELTATVATIKLCVEELNKESVRLYKEHGSIEQNIATLKERKQELEKAREEYAVYELFLQCMDSKGIVFSVIKQKLPEINEAIAEVLNNIVDFEISFVGDESRLDIYIKYPNYSERLIEMASGAEKMIAAMAIRLALIKVGTLPKSNVFFMDEPAVGLDAENLEGFTKLMEMVKSQFKVIFLISHMDSLKDCADDVLTIEKKGGYAYLNV